MFVTNSKSKNDTNAQNLRKKTIKKWRFITEIAEGTTISYYYCLKHEKRGSSFYPKIFNKIVYRVTILNKYVADAPDQTQTCYNWVGI